MSATNKINLKRKFEWKINDFSKDVLGLIGTEKVIQTEDFEILIGDNHTKW